MNTNIFLDSKPLCSILAILIWSACSVTLPSQLTAQQFDLTSRTLFITGDRYRDDVEVRGVTDWISIYFDGRIVRNFRARDIDVIDVSLGSGDDNFQATGITIPRELNVHTGSGTDTVNISDVNIDSLNVFEGETMGLPPAYSWATVTLDDVRADSCQVQCEDLAIDQGDFDSCQIAAAYQDIRHVSAWSIICLNEIDARICEMTLNDIQSNSMYVISDVWRSRNVEDTILMSNIRTWRLSVYTSSNEDYVRLTGSDIMGSINIDTGSNKDADFVYLNNVYSQGQVTVETGDADDDVYMIQCEFESSTYVQTRGGADFAYCYNCDFGSVYSVQTGSGNDRARFSRSSVPTAAFNGGSGTQDRLELYRHNIVSQNRSGFEIVID